MSSMLRDLLDRLEGRYTPPTPSNAKPALVPVVVPAGTSDLDVIKAKMDALNGKDSEASANPKQKEQESEAEDNVSGEDAQKLEDNTKTSNPAHLDDESKTASLAKTSADSTPNYSDSTGEGYDDSSDLVAPKMESDSRSLASTDDKIGTSAALPSTSATNVPSSGYGAGLNSEALQAAMAHQKQNNMAALLGKAGDQIGAGFAAGVGANVSDKNDVLDALQAQGKQGVDNIMLGRQASDQDIKHSELLDSYKSEQSQNSPTSAESAFMRDQLKSMVKNVPDDLTYSQAMKFFPTLSKQIISSNMLKFRELGLQNKQDNQDHKYGKEDEDTQAKIAKDLNASTASSRSVLGGAAKARMGIQRLQKILNNPDATYQDLSSVAADLNQVISNSTTISGSEHQAYDNLSTRYAKMKSFILSKPEGVVEPEVKKHILDVAGDMNVISDDIINRNSKLVQSGRSGWISRHPDQWTQLLAESGPGQQSQNSSNSNSQSSQSSAAPHGGKYPPGSTIQYQGKPYVVGDDGDSLTPK